MAISLCRINLSTDQSEFYSVCMADEFRETWEPTIAKLRLPMLECLPALTLSDEFKDRFLDELRTLKRFVAEQHDESKFRKMEDSIGRIIAIVDSTNFQEFEISFG